MALGVRGLLQHHGQARFLPVARLALGLDVAHDLVLAPVVIVVGAALARVIPARHRAPVQAGLILSAVVALYAYPLVRGFGRSPAAGPSRLPGNYGAGLVLVLAAIWAVVLAFVAVSQLRARPPR
jgi:hypothetical protein